MNVMTSSAPRQVKRDRKGRIMKGSPAAFIPDAHRARRNLNTATIRELHEAFNRGGRQAIDKVMKNSPAQFLKLLVLLVPRELQIEHSSTVKNMTDEQIEDAIAAIRAMIAQRDAGASAKVIEAVSAPRAVGVLSGLEPDRAKPLDEQ